MLKGLLKQDVLHKIIALFLVITLLFLAISSLENKSFTTDEANYLHNGEKLAKNLNWDHYVLRFHPPLTFYYHGLLTLFNISIQDGNKLLYARLMMMPILAFFAIAVYKTAKRLYGAKAGLLALFLFCFDPNILAHGHLITADISLAMFIFLFLISFYNFLTAKDKLIGKVVAPAIILGLALLTKYNGLMLIPLSFLLFLIYWFLSLIKKTKLKNKFILRRFFYLFLIYLVAVFIVNLGYGFKSSFFLPEEFKTTVFQSLSKNPILKNLIIIFPGAYLQGADYQLFESQRDFYWQFFWGTRYTKGPWYFFPLSFLLKTPIPFLILLLFFIELIFKKEIKKTYFEFYLFFSCLFFFIYFSFFNKLIIGFRYILMIFPLLFVLVSQLVNINFKNKIIKKYFKVFLGFLLSWYFIGTVKTHPHYLAYVNESIGGPNNAWKYYADSNLDWGQNWSLLYQFKGVSNIKLIDDPKEPVVGKILVSVNSLNLHNYDKYLWLRQLEKEPIANVGYTWLIFDITEQDIQKLKSL